ncbi:PREDICTED: uncharacterized protein LOC105966424 [Erythranthe guttata]|uniref:uncharacterized protein LOC105966424 n=1 Tax=Erythranthe guttata TaxID=4155 RepID=UPI00064DF024|nr:PREDICTED: uncharacterized protein LOC105966424 [Erythranthe guttata]|eukprot:XP_012846432.1 PREDICTED: uncharacterized protein LOC105966424 [Erythranthe guttata]
MGRGLLCHTTMATQGNKWAIVMSRGIELSDQVVELDFLYPSEGVHKRLDAGYFITSVAATQDQVAVVLSFPKQKPSNTTQETHRTPSFPCELIKENRTKNLYITSLCYGRSIV